MAIVILGGLVTSTLLNLFVVTAIYLRFGRYKDRLQAVDEATPRLAVPVAAGA